MKKINKVFFKTAIVSSLLMANASMAMLEEVIVTAEKREQNLQDTPISIEALTAGAIERKGITDISSLLNSVPGVQGYEAPSARGNFSVNLRGIGSGNPNSPSTDPANAIYIDGVYLGKGIGNGVDAMDIERIEVLRGPQGTLYGRNSTGGAINFITKKPSQEAAVKLKVSMGNLGYGAASGRVDVPLSETSAMSVSAYTRNRDDLYGNTNPNMPGFENIDRQGYRLALNFNPSDSMSVDYTYSHDSLDEHAQMMDVVGLNPRDPGVVGNSGYPNAVTTDSGERAATVAALAGGVRQLQGAAAFVPAYQAFLMPQINTFLGWADSYIGWSADQLATRNQRPDKGSSDAPSTSTNEVSAHTLTLNWDLNESTSFKSITSLRTAENLNTGDLDGMDNSQVLGDLPLLTIGGLLFNQVVPDAYGVGAAQEFAMALNMISAIEERGSAPVYNNWAKTDHDQWSQEFQIVGSSPTLDYVVGLFFYDDETQFRNHRTASFPLATSDTSSYDVESKASSLFGQATWRQSEDSPLSVTAGLRYTKETKGITYLWKGYNSDFVTRFFPYLMTGRAAQYDVADNYVTNEMSMDLPERAGIYGRKFEQDFNNLSGRLTLQYALDDDSNVYATYSTGYRSGGFNGDFFDTANDTADAFDEEEIKNFEIGYKSTFWDGRAQFNGALFAYDYTNLQVSSVLAKGNTVTSAIGNAGETSREGGELSLLVSPTDDLLLSLAYTFIDGTFDKFPDVVAGNNVLDMGPIVERGMSPKNQVNAGLNWTAVRTTKGQLDWSIDASYQSETYSMPSSTGVYKDATGAATLPVAFQLVPNQARTLVNTRLSWEQEMESGNTFTFSIWGNNITDEEYRTFGFNYGPALGLNLHNYGAPRTYGMDIAVQF